MQIWFIIEILSLALTVPVLALSYYWLLLLVSSFRYPRDLGSHDVHLQKYPLVSILISTFNEKLVIGKSLEVMKHLDYPKSQLQVVVADDSTDDTVGIIDEKVRELNRAGIKAVVSRRAAREHFKCGALNQAMNSVIGDYVLLLDADSVIPPDILSKGISALDTHPRASFVSFRYGHYNRNYNLITRLFALSQDFGDTVSKMGAYRLDAPFSSQGGFTLVRARELREVGQWTNQRIADDADISIKMYLKGKRGIYLSNVKIMSEDPSTLEAWKKQVARTSQGWWRCIAHYWKTIILARGISIPKKIGLFLMLMGPFSSISWIIVTFLSALEVMFHLVPPLDSIFTNPIYIAIVTIPFVITLFSCAWALWVQGILTLKNAIFIPALSYATACMLTLGSIGFFYGVFDRPGFFYYRTPKSGSEKHMTRTVYFRNLTNGRYALIEGGLSIAGIALAVYLAFSGVWFLALSLGGFGAFTLKSMNLTRGLRREKAPELVLEEIAPEIGTG